MPVTHNMDSMTRGQAIGFIRYHGVVLEGAKGLEPCLAEKIAGEEISGSWWGHASGREIYELTQTIRHSSVVLVCTLAKGKITYIHRRLWPHFIRVSGRFSKHALDKVVEVHLPNGRHKRQDAIFPTWVTPDVANLAEALSLDEAKSEVSVWLARYGK